MPSLPVCLIFKVGWPVLCLGLKVMQLSSADYNLRKRLKCFSPVCLTQLVSMTAEAVGSSCFSIQITSSSRRDILLCLTCFEAYFPIFVVEVRVDEVPEDVRSVRQ